MTSPTPLVARPARPVGTDVGVGGPPLTRVVAVLATVSITLNVTLAAGVTTAGLTALVLAPVWWSSLREYVGARVLVATAALASASGLWLAAYSSATHTVSPLLLRSTLFLVVGGFCAVGVLLWARTVLPMRAVGVAAGVGLALRLVVDPPDPVNPWKFGIAYAVAVLLLGALAGTRPRWMELVVLVGLAAASAVNDSRSWFATLMLAAVLLLWQLRPRTLGRRASAFATIALMAAVSVCVYIGGTALIVEGYLGEETQRRSIEQIETSGSLLLGGRPEWGAGLALLEHRPWGYGLGVRANLEDILVAKSGMAELNYDPNNGYVENYMFGAEIKLHAVVADFWSNFGVPGIALAAVVTGLVGWSLATAVARRTAGGLVLFLTCTSLWNLLWGPLYTSMPALVLTIGLLLVRRTPRATVHSGTVVR